MAAYTDAMRAREAEFAARAAKHLERALAGDDASKVGIVSATVDEPMGKSPVMRVEVIVPLTTEEALRLRYGDDVDIARTPSGGWTVTIPIDAPKLSDVPLVE